MIKQFYLKQFKLAVVICFLSVEMSNTSISLIDNHIYQPLHSGRIWYKVNF